MITVLGEALWDVYPASRGERLRVRRREVRHPGGAPANVARTLARLGVAVRFVGAVGDDALGDGLVDALVADGVDASRVVRVRARTGVTFVDPLPDGGCAFVPYREHGADFLLRPEAVADLDLPMLHVGSSSFARAPVRDAVTLAVARARRVSLDLNVYRWMWSEPILPALAPTIAAAEIVKASEDDLRALGLDAESLHAHRPARLTVVTRGPRGAIAFAGNDRLEIGALASLRGKKVVDPTGGGDAFMAGLLSVLWPAGDLRRALDRGAELAARAVAKVGATSWLG